MIIFSLSSPLSYISKALYCSPKSIKNRLSLLLFLSLIFPLEKTQANSPSQAQDTTQTTTQAQKDTTQELKATDQSQKTTTQAQKDTTQVQKDTTQELKATDFYICIKKTATELQSRVLRIHQEEKKCAVFYSVKGKDELISHGKWLRFCRKKLVQTIENLEKGLWDCKKKPEVQVLYSL